MLKLLWFILKISFLVTVAVWLASHEGVLNVQWQNYDMRISIGFFLLSAFLAVLIIVGLSRFLAELVYLPIRYRDRKKLANAEEGLASMTLSVSAAMSGNYAQIQYHAQRAEKLLPGQQALPGLLKAYAYRMRGHPQKADATLQALLEHKQGAILAARALVHNALRDDHLSLALDYARTTFEEYKGPDDVWLLKTVYELEARSGHWKEALQLLDKVGHRRLLDAETILQDRAALTTALGLEYRNAQDLEEASRLFKKALKQYAGFVPAARELAKIEFDRQRFRAAAKIIKKCWAVHPHPDLYHIWLEIGAHGGKPNTSRQIQQLVRQAPEHPESLYILAAQYIETDNATEARKTLERAILVSPEERFYQLLSQLDEMSEKSESSLQSRSQDVTTAKANPVWICQKTGMIYQDWSPIAFPHRSFNTITWASPDEIMVEHAQNYIDRKDETIDMITASA